jgi:hypothetical protein
MRYDIGDPNPLRKRRHRSTDSIVINSSGPPS